MDNTGELVEIVQYLQSGSTFADLLDAVEAECVIGLLIQGLPDGDQSDSYVNMVPNPEPVVLLLCGLGVLGAAGVMACICKRELDPESHSLAYFPQ